MRYCPQCRQRKPEGDFYRHRRRGFQRCCKPCQSKASRRWYRKNSQAVVERSRNRKNYNRMKAAEHLAAHPCVDCGEPDLVVLDFHHLGKKICTVSRLIHSTAAWSRVREEIDKCQVLCANCHRRRTARQFQWKWRLGWPPGGEGIL